ncbi:MAG: heme ABC transporter ATP-binding protein [SAR202 cluster bacterium]|nr:heme ABC transporter ATP-binding protein [SAR202 cluster bacterium]
MLEIRDVHFSYNGLPVLRGLSLSVGPGELVGVVGPNGAGKTTLLRLIAGVLAPSSGHVLVSGLDLRSVRPAERARMVAAVPQSAQVPRGFSVLDVVLMGRNPHLGLLQWEGKRDLQIAASAMEQMGIAGLAERQATELSGGEQQRVVVAMALAQEAPVLLLDEPTSNLDLAHQQRVMELVREMCRERDGAVMVSMHDLTLAGQSCDRLVMLAEGRVWAEGVPGEVLTAESIRKVYGVDVVVAQHPQSGGPVVLPAATH